MIGGHLGSTRADAALDLEAATVLVGRFVTEQHRPSPEGRRVMAALLDEMERSMPRGLRKLPRTSVWHAVGPEIATNLAVPRPAWWSPALRPLAAVGRGLTGMPLLRRISGLPLRLLGVAVMRMYIDAGMQGERIWFRVTEEQRRRWRLRGFGTLRTSSRRRRLERRGGPPAP